MRVNAFNWIIYNSFVFFFLGIVQVISFCLSPSLPAYALCDAMHEMLFKWLRCVINKNKINPTDQPADQFIIFIMVNAPNNTNDEIPSYPRHKIVCECLRVPVPHLVFCFVFCFAISFALRSVYYILHANEIIPDNFVVQRKRATR